jgi:hypothetical protein
MRGVPRWRLPRRPDGSVWSARAILRQVRIEGMEFEETAESREELLALADLLRAEGYEVYVAGRGESFHSRLQESLEQTAADVLNIVLDGAQEVGIAIISAKLLEWAGRRRQFGTREDGVPVAVIWGPNGEVLADVPLPPPAESEPQIEDNASR